MQVLHGFKFKVEPLGDHTFEVEPQKNIDQGAGLKKMIWFFLADARMRSELPRVCWIKQREMYLTLLEGQSMLSLEGSLSGDYDVRQNGNLKANLQHMEALSTTEVGYMTFTEA
nr:hypothetical protein [Tanacetum cinerariifolium]